MPAALVTPNQPVTPKGIKPYAPTGGHKLDLRTLAFYDYTGIIPAVAQRRPEVMVKVDFQGQLRRSEAV